MPDLEHETIRKSTELLDHWLIIVMPICLWYITSVHISYVSFRFREVRILC